MEKGKPTRSGKGNKNKNKVTSPEPSLLNSPEKPPQGNIEDSVTQKKKFNAENVNNIDSGENAALSKEDSKQPAAEEKNRKPDGIELTLERISALQDELANQVYNDSDSDDDDGNDDDFDEDSMKFDAMNGIHKIDAKTLGFLACAQETMKYLADQGIPKDNPMVISLRNRLIEGINRI